MIGLGGAEFRLPLLIGLFGFAAPAAVILNKSMSLIVVLTALPARLAAEDAGFHAFRHTFASLLIAKNVSPTVIQARMGHASITETTDTYDHLYRESEEVTTSAIDDALDASKIESVDKNDDTGTVRLTFRRRFPLVDTRLWRRAGL